MHKPALEPQPRHLVSAVSLGFNGRYNRLITVGGVAYANVRKCASLHSSCTHGSFAHLTCAHPTYTPQTQNQVTAQCREAQVGEYMPLFNSMLKSFTPPAKKVL